MSDSGVPELLEQSVDRAECSPHSSTDSKHASIGLLTWDGLEGVHELITKKSLASHVLIDSLLFNNNQG